MARENLFVPAAVPEKSIMRMRGEIDPQIAAEEYAQQLDAIAAEEVNPFISTTSFFSALATMATRHRFFQGLLRWNKRRVELRQTLFRN